MNLQKLIIKHEGLELKPYLDSVGKITIGAGHNLSDNGIPEPVAMFLLNGDIADATSDLYNRYPWVQDLDQIRREALINMVFNMGISRFSTFVRMIAALMIRNYHLAAYHAIDSKWASQVGDRADEIAHMIRTGEYRT